MATCVYCTNPRMAGYATCQAHVFSWVEPATCVHLAPYTGGHPGQPCHDGPCPAVAPMALYPCCEATTVPAPRYPTASEVAVLAANRLVVCVHLLGDKPCHSGLCPAGDGSEYPCCGEASDDDDDDSGPFGDYRPDTDHSGHGPTCEACGQPNDGSECSEAPGSDDDECPTCPACAGDVAPPQSFTPGALCFDCQVLNDAYASATRCQGYR